MIYFLEDDNSIRELVVYTMNSTGFEAVGFGKPGEFWAAMERETPEPGAAGYYAARGGRPVHFENAAGQAQPPSACR